MNAIGSKKAPTENHMENHIFDHGGFQYQIKIPGYKPWDAEYSPDVLKRQVIIRGYRADLIGITQRGVDIIELKKNILKWEDLFQLRRYMTLMNEIWFEEQAHILSGLEHDLYLHESAKASYQSAFMTYGYIIGYGYPSDNFVFIAHELNIRVMTYNFWDGQYFFHSAQPDTEPRTRESYQNHSNDQSLMELFRLASSLNEAGGVA